MSTLKENTRKRTREARKKKVDEELPRAAAQIGIAADLGEDQVTMQQLSSPTMARLRKEGFKATYTGDGKTKIMWDVESEN